MNEIFDKLGAVARKAATSVTTEVNVASEEQKIKDSYQAIGKLYYQAKTAGKPVTGDEFDAYIKRIDDNMKRIKDLKSKKNVSGAEEVYADEEDFVTVEDEAKPEE